MVENNSEECLKQCPRCDWRGETNRTYCQNCLALDNEFARLQDLTGEEDAILKAERHNDGIESGD